MSNMAVFTEAAAIMEVMITATVPSKKMRLRPTLSARRPKISTNMVLAIKNAIGTQVMATAVSDRLEAMVGSATFADDNISGTANAFSRIINRMMRWWDWEAKTSGSRLQ